MKQYPTIPLLDDAPGLLDGGHLWVQELIDGSLLRFTVADDGTLAFGDSQRTFDDDPPLSLRLGIRHVRESLDWETLYADATDPSAVTFFGVAPRFETVDYDWERIPAFLGTDVWTDEREAFLPPDAVERVYEGLGLRPITVLQKELPVRDFDADTYEIPQSAWDDGPAKGVVLRTKQGDRAKLQADDLPSEDHPGADVPTEPDAIVERYLTDDLLARVADTLRSDDEYADAEMVHERALETVAREHYRELDRAGIELDTRAVRTAARERVRSWLDARPKR